MQKRSFLLLFCLLCSAILSVCHAATFTVTTTADSGAGSLRQAIADANTNAGADIIDFNIAPAGEKTISLPSGGQMLPEITDPVTIDGTTQPGFSTKAIIEINGGSVAAAIDGLRITTSNCVIRGLVINRFKSDGIEISGGGNNTIEGCIIGLNLAGATDLGNSTNGVLIINSSSNIVGGATAAARNIISGNNQSGVRIEGATATANLIKGNIIGLDLGGTIDRGNGVNGVYVNQAPSNTIGGATAAERNVISGNDQAGILIEGAGAEQNLVLGNYIGLDITGAVDLGNTTDGVRINLVSNNTVGGTAAGQGNLISGNNSDGIEIIGATATNNAALGNIIGLDAAGSVDRGNTGNGVFINQAAANIVGGAAAGARNIISGNDQSGIRIEGAGAEGNVVYGNYIGSDPAGAVDLGNTADGVVVLAANNKIGGAVSGQGNLISGNNGDGIELNGANATNIFIFANSIGLNATGTALANTGHGVQITGNASFNLVGLGGTAGNTIAFNGADGIYVNSGTNNTLRGNSTFSNVGLGIDLDPNGGTANDANDVDTGANQRQNFPVLTSAVTTPSDTTISGTMNGAPSTEFIIDFYGVTAPDGTGSGEGQQYLGSTIVTTDGSGNVSFNPTLPAAATGKFVTATATDPFGNTSEFSVNVAASTTVPGTTFTVTTTADAGAGSLRQAIIDANAVFTLNTIAFSIPGDGPHTITLATALPSITNTIIIDGYTQPGAVANTDAAAFNGIIKIILNGSTTVNFDGLSLQWPGVVVRGLNIIAMRGDGVEIGAVATGSAVEGCVIGMDLASVARANTGAGIYVNNSTGNQIGGTAVGARNVISGNSNAGILVDGAGSSGNTVLGNNIGATLSGLAKIANGQDGIRINNSANNTIGGTAAGARNVISGNTGEGIEIIGATASNNVVQGNYIGPDITGNAGLRNTSHGVVFNSNARSNVIGTTAAGGGNLIAFNDQDGIFVGSGTNNTLRANLIHSNNGLGIDLDVNGVTANDVGDADGAANQKQNFPLITSSVANAADTQVSGTLNSGTNVTYTIDIYSNIAADGTGNGEGQQYLGSTQVTTDGSGSATFNVTLPAVTVGKFICATATDPFGNTSEFGPCTAASSTVAGQTFTVINTNDSGAGSLRQAILDANLVFNSGDTIVFNIPGDGPHTNVVSTALPAITDKVTINGYSQSGATANASAAGFNAVIKIVLNGASAPNNTDGLSVQWSGVVIRGLNIAAFKQDGIEIGALGSDCVVDGCIIGLGLDGADLGNTAHGIFINGASNVLVGGTTPAARNIISGNGFDGVNIAAATASGNQVKGNFIGTGLNGTTRISNGDAVQIRTGAHNNVISGNVLSGNSGDGVEINGAGTSDNIVTSNYIGTDPTGAISVANNQIGVSITSGAVNNRVGGAAAGEGNRIAFNGSDGVAISSNNTTNNAVRANSIVSNGDIGIDLANNGFTANDAGDADTGPNTLQNTPVLTSATANVANTSIQGTLNSKAGTLFTLDFFSNFAPESNNRFEGDKYLGSTTVTTDGTGNVSFDVTVNGVVNGRFITATATDPDGNTSEFSPGLRAESTIPAPTLLVTTTADAGAGSLRQALIDAGNYISGEPVKINFQIPGAGPHTIAPATQLPTPTEAVALDGYTQTGAAANTLAQGNNATLMINLSGTNASFIVGLRMTNSGNVIKGLAITDFAQDGINLHGNSNRVEGCFIGVMPDGTAEGNGSAGIRIALAFGSSFGALNNIVGGTTPAARNVISGNGSYGVYIDSGGSNIVQGNYVGTNPQGTEARGNGTGVYISSSIGNLVGGAAAGQGNLLSGNFSHGVVVSHNSDAKTQILGNRIGTDAAGTGSIPNGIGVQIQNAAGSVIGGVNAGEANVIAHNTSFGVQIYSGGGQTNNTVRGNSISDNGNLGIELGFDSVTENDAGDADDGPNRLQNFPVITSATATPADTTIAGTLNSVASRTYTVDFYANQVQDFFGNGEGQQYLGSTSVPTDASGNGTFNVTLPAIVTGRFITATATHLETGTSEFSDSLEAATTFPIQTFMVTTTNNTGPGSLRQAILDNNISVAGGNNIIAFNIPGDGPHRIVPSLDQLPTITHPVTIDGLTQPGALANTQAVGNNSVLKIGLAGDSLPFTPGLIIQAPGSIIRGLSIKGFVQQIHVTGANVKVAGCWICLNPDGTSGGNQATGVMLNQGANNAVIGGTAVADRNVISGAGSIGIQMSSQISGARVEGNYIGLKPSGLEALGNGLAAIFVSGSNHAIGGAAAGAGNAIGGGNGVQLSSATNCAVQGNFIGTDALGTSRLAAAFGTGVEFQGNSVNNLIGGGGAGERNVISGNGNYGVSVFGFGTTGNRILGNFVGTDVTGTLNLGNGFQGIVIGVTGNSVGGATEAEGNVIAYNQDNAITVSSGAQSAPIRRNRIFANNRLGIDLDGAGVTENDATDADTGGNFLQNFPVITSATIGVSDTQIAGFLQSAASQAFDLDFFANGAADPSGFGEGEQYLGSITVNTGADGRADFSVTLPKMAVGRHITATATDSQNNSSEFSAAFRANSSRPPHTFIVTSTNDSGAGSLREALTLADGFQSSGPNKIHFNIPGAGVQVIDVLSQLPSPVEAVEVNGFTQPGALANTEAERDVAVRLIHLRGAQLNSFEDGIRFTSVGNILKGLIISEFPASGIALNMADNTVVEGSLVYSNRSNGILIESAIGALVGGAAVSARNVVYGNFNSGVVVSGPSFGENRASNNRVLGNFIGIDGNAVNDSFRVQFNGVSIASAPRTQVGGPAPGEANWIASNIRGVTVQSGVENSIRGNRIFNNTGLALDLGINGATQNDVGDLDAGANNLQNYPVVQTANVAVGGVHFVGTLNSIASSSFTIDFYWNASCDALGTGEGALHLGQTVVLTDASGNVTFDVVLSGTVQRGVITATATDSLGNTSEFSACTTIGSEIPPQSFTVINTNDSGPGSLRQAILDANNAFTTGRNFISFNIPGAGVHVISPATPLPDVTAPVIINGFSQPGSQANTSATTINAIFLIRLDGVNAGANADGLRIASNDCVVRGLIITRFSAAGVRVLNVNNVVVTENLIGATEVPTSPPSVAPKKRSLQQALPPDVANMIGIFLDRGQNFSTQPDNPNVIGNGIFNNVGGGIYSDRSVNLSLRNAIIQANGADTLQSGGGINLLGTTDALIDNATISGNRPNGVEAGRGGATFGNGLAIRNSTISGNLAGANGGGAGVFINNTGADRIENSTISGNQSHGVQLFRSNTGLDVFGNDIVNNGGLGVLAEESLFVNIGDSQLDRRNVVANNGQGGVGASGFGIRWYGNEFGPDQLPFLLEPPSGGMPDLEGERRVQGDQVIFKFTGGPISPNQSFTFVFGAMGITPLGPMIVPLGEVTVTSDGNGLFTVEIPFPANNAPPFLMGMASFSSGDTTPPIFAETPNGPGNATVDLNGPSQVPVGTDVQMNALFQYNPSQVNPQSILFSEINIPAGFDVLNTTVTPSQGNVPRIFQHGNTLFFNGYLTTMEQVSVNIDLHAQTVGTFNVSPELNVLLGDNSLTGDDTSDLLGRIYEPTPGVNTGINPLTMGDLDSDGEVNIVDLKIFSLGTQEPTGLKVSVTSSDDLTVIPPFLPVDGNTLNFDPAQNLFSGFPAPDAQGQFRLPFGILAATPGTKTFTVRVEQNEVDVTPTDNIRIFNFTVLPPFGNTFDFGDAPTTYGTLDAANGPKHLIIQNGIRLGLGVGADADGMPSPGANSDPSDDGVVVPNQLFAGLPGLFDVTVNKPGFLTVVGDWNGDGDFDIATIPSPGGAPEVLTPLINGNPDPFFGLGSYPLVQGLNHVQINIPNMTFPGPVTFRFRVSSQEHLSPFGAAIDGEVEDYTFPILNGTVDTLFGTATVTDPTPYTGQQTLITIPVINNGTTPATDVDIIFDPGVTGSVFGPYEHQFDFNPVLDRLRISTVGPGETKNVTVGVNYSTPGSKTFAYHVDPFQPEVNTQNNDGSFIFIIKADPPPPFDYGDAPDTYRTLNISIGAKHALVTDGPKLGPLVDQDADGVPTVHGDGDDTDADGDDEDGVIFRGPLVAGVMTPINITVSKDCKLDAWIDYNGDGKFDENTKDDEPHEYICADIEGHPPLLFGFAQSYPLKAGLNQLRLFVPNGPYTSVPRHARFRVSTGGWLTSGGAAPDGEVEDYQVQVFDLSPDMGDAPDSYLTPQYPTLLVHDGAVHLSSEANFHLGARIDFEPDGLPSLTALGDDQDNGLEFPQSDEPDDEDGVTFTGALLRGRTVDVNVFLTRELPGPAKLNAWIDFNRDFDWSDVGEQIFNNTDLIPGNNVLQVPIPAGAALGQTYARFRLSRIGNLQPTGIAVSGEVEDYRVEITEASQDAPQLRFSLDAVGMLTISWDGPGRLQSAPTVLGAWNDDAEGNPIVVDTRVGMKFFRARR